MPDVDALLADLDAESAELDRLVAGLDAAGWATPTPAPGWTVAHQVAHLAWTDDIAVLSATDPGAFRERLRAVDMSTVDVAAAEGAATAPDELLHRWRGGRSRLAAALRSRDAAQTVPWFGPPMRATSMVTARIMETWAHGQDVVDALGATRAQGPRLRHVAHIAVRARDFAHAVHGMPAPDVQFRVELTAPDGDTWTWGPPGAAQRVTGPAVDFCLLATRRRHPDDTAMRAEGADARQWLAIAQAFAGPPGDGRAAGQFGKPATTDTTRPESSAGGVRP